MRGADSGNSSADKENNEVKGTDLVNHSVDDSAIGLDANVVVPNVAADFERGNNEVLGQDFGTASFN